MAAPIVRKKPAWLKDKEKAAAPRPTTTAAPALPAAAAATAADDDDMFSRAAHTLTWAEDQQRRTAGAKHASPNPAKRRRVSGRGTDDVEAEDAEGRAESPGGLSAPGSASPQPRQAEAPISPAGVRQSIEQEQDAAAVRRGTRSSPRRPAKSTPVEVEAPQDDADLTVEAVKAAPTPKSQAAPVVVDDAPSSSSSPSDAGDDEDFDQILRRAQKRRARETARHAAAGARSPPIPGTATDAPAPPPSTQAPDARLKILVHSRIANTTPMFGEVLLSTRLKVLRTTWCSRQPFDAGFAAGVFLTWRGLKIYDWTTVRSLGVTVDAAGAAVWKTKGRISEASANLEMEAMTADMFEAAAAARARRTDDDDGHGAETQFQPPPAAADAPSKIRIIIKAQGYEDYKLRVNPDTSVAQIIGAFRKTRGVPGDKAGFVMVDGERLDAGAEVRDTEIGDMDEIDLYLK